MGSLSILDPEGSQRMRKRKEEKTALLRMCWVCQMTHSGILRDGDAGSIDRQHNTCSGMLDIHTLLKGRVSLKCSINLSIVLHVITAARIHINWR